MNWWPRLACMLLVPSFVAVDPLYADEAIVKQQQEELRKLLDASLKEFQVTSNVDRSVTKGEIVFRWDNRERGSADGCTALWYDKARRPIAVASVYPYNGNLVHEFDLLDRRAAAVGKRNGVEFWRPRESTVLEYKPIPDAPTPASSKTRRRIQMKSIATRYQVEMTGWKPDASDREVLRMLPTPVHRYGSEDADAEVLDGAFFLFVKGTDPEAGLVVEAHKHGDGYRWEYGLIPQTSGALEARYQKKVVWKKTRNSHHASHGFSARSLPPNLAGLR